VQPGVKVNGNYYRELLLLLLMTFTAEGEAAAMHQVNIR